MPQGYATGGAEKMSLFADRLGPCFAQAVTVLAFSNDGAVLLTGGEDTVASAWLLSDVLDVFLGAPGSGGAAAAARGPQTFQSWYVVLL